jgi:hypothetical protein
MVISSDVPSICLICVMEPLSAALKDRTILNPAETMCTTPSVDAMKRLEEPALREVRSDYAESDIVRIQTANRRTI